MKDDKGDDGYDLVDVNEWKMMYVSKDRVEAQHSENI